ncbi:hypothetical protein EB796_017317 [Bugula neritina]|uniref:WAP domain-containing protein n=1 Tax=Bugula neritina TaxID=10212 RepID=A0A7J7JE71_BUGNE|nr:hypothetical protein EB796_017317 [Bugula neritina]
MPCKHHTLLDQHHTLLQAQVAVTHIKMFKVAVLCFAVFSFAAASLYGPRQAPTAVPPPPACRICAPNECGLVLPEFRFSCPNGNILDKCGCVESCQCAGCPPFNLGLSCPFGKKADSKGCPLSICNPPPCEFAGDCAAVSCFAGFGNAVDSKQCPLRGCPCQGAANCPAVDNCNIDCSGRGGYRLNRHNCVTCQCAQKPGSCPTYGVWGSRTCRDDYDCAGNQKCCQLLHSRVKKCHGSLALTKGHNVHRPRY